MQNLGIKLVAVSYCCTGALLGQFIRAAFLGRHSDWLPQRMDLLAFAMLSNFIALSCLAVVFRRRAVEPPIDGLSRPFEVLLGDSPANNRVAFLIFSVAWLMGVLLGMSFSIQ